jgi:hypothetical protein
MKKVSLLLFLLAISLGGYSQDDVNVNVKKTHKVFCELLGTEKFLSKKCTVQIDFGQNPYKDNRIVDENGKSKTFNSMVDAMNFMGSLGWEFEQAYVVTITTGMTGQNVYHWLLSKDIMSDEELTEGFKTKADLKK